MSDEELRDELMTLLVAGHETTATALAWTAERLVRTPAGWAALQAGGEEYAEAAGKEALRLRPVIAGVGRVVRGGPYELGGYVLPPGIEINPSIAGIHRRADRYPRPREFRPERFLEPGAPDTYSWLPFGGGTRRCIGAAFAQFEMRVVLSTILARAALLAASEPPEPIARRNVTLAPRHGTPAILVGRRG